MKKLSIKAQKSVNGGAKAIAYCWTCKDAGIIGWRSNTDGTSGITSSTVNKNARKTLDLHRYGTNGHYITYIVL
jgi:hypothetical protein